jgi:hypothetical protein
MSNREESEDVRDEIQPPGDLGGVTPPRIRRPSECLQSTRLCRLCMEPPGPTGVY